MSLETITREYWFASSFLKGRHVPRLMSRTSAETCLRHLAFGCRWRALRRAAVGSATGHSLIPGAVTIRAEWLLPCDTEPEAAP
jgi:hypothetical protein